MRPIVENNYAANASNSGKGTLIDNPSDYSSLLAVTGTATLEVPTSPPDDETKVLQLDYDAGAESQGDLKDVTGITFTKVDTFGFWVNNPTNNTLAFTVDIWSVGFAHTVKINMAAQAGSGWRFYVASFPGFASNTMVSGDIYERIRFKTVKTDTFFPWVSGDSLQFGKLYLNPRSRPKFCIGTDDGYAANLVDGSGYPTGYPASGGNYLDIANAYGFKGTAFITNFRIGTANYMTWAQVKQLEDAGWLIGNHMDGEYVGGGNEGATNLTYTQMVADLSSMISIMEARGHTDGSHIYAIQQGAWNEDLLNAADSLGLMKIGISSLAGGTVTGRVPVGFHSQGGQLNGTSLPTTNTGQIEFTSRAQLDGTPTLSDVTDYIDMLIDAGASGGCYTHNIDAAKAVIFDGMCAHLKIRQDQGLIDVVNFKQWRDGL